MNDFTPSNTARIKKWKGFLRKSLILPATVIIIFGLLGLYLIINSVRSSSPSPVLSENDQRIDLKKPKAEQAINKDFLFPLRGNDGKEVSKLRFTIEDAELRDEIIVKGERAVAVKGRVFLIVSLRITNDYERPVSINSRDYIRLTINNNKDRLAPEIHNDPVEVQAISTKHTRLGFPINDTDKNLSLQVGEITGNKETIKINLK